MKRTDIINHLIKKNNYKRYLEIGVRNPDENLNKIIVEHKNGVDPSGNCDYPIPSDDFFNQLDVDVKYDIIFIDGLHHADQVTKDIKNSFNHLVHNGFIVMHDCNPVSYEAQLIPRETVAWNGDTWKSFVGFKMDNKDFKSTVIDKFNNIVVNKEFLLNGFTNKNNVRIESDSISTQRKTLFVPEENYQVRLVKHYSNKEIFYSAIRVIWNGTYYALHGFTSEQGYFNYFIPATNSSTTAKTIGKCPSWHLGAGGTSWLFADEISM
mgnify:CR=1 FL=1